MESAAERENAIPVSLVLGPPGAGKSTLLWRLAQTSSRGMVLMHIEDDHTQLFGFVRGLVEAIAPLSRSAELSYRAIHERTSSIETPALQLSKWFVAHMKTVEATVAIDNIERIAEHDDIVQFMDETVRQTPLTQWILAGRSFGSFPVANWLAYGIAALPNDLAAPAEFRTVDQRLEALRPDQRALVACTIEFPLVDPWMIPAEIAAPEDLRALRIDAPLLFEYGSVPRYRYDVRAEVSRRRKERDPAGYLRLIRTTGSALEKGGAVADAMRLYVRTLQIDPLRELLERIGLGLADTLAPELLNVALAMIPEELETSSGVLMSLRAAAASRAARYDVSETLYINAIRVAPHDTAGRIAYAYGCDLLRRNRADCRGVFESILETETLDDEREALTRSALAQSYVMASERDLAIVEIGRALALSPSLPLAERAVVETRAAYVYFYANKDFGLAEEYARRAVESALRASAYVPAIGALSILYNVACENDDAVAAVEFLERLADCGIRVGNVDFQSYALMAMLEFQVEAKDEAAIARTIETLDSFDLHYETIVTSDVLLPSEALKLAWSGQFDRAYLLLEPSAEQQHGSDFKALRYAQVALYAAGAGRIESARAKADDAAELLESLDPSGQKAIRAGILAALAVTIAGEHERAATLLLKYEPFAERFARLRALARATRAVRALWTGEGASGELTLALSGLAECRFGGMGAMIANLPVAAPQSVRNLADHYARVAYG